MFNKPRTMRSEGSSLDQYTDALLEAGYIRILDSSTVNDAERQHDSVDEHRRILEGNKTTIKELIKSPMIRDASGPMLLHPDLNKRNIFVSPEDPTKITDVIDWRSSCIEPTFVYANRPPDLMAPRQFRSSGSETSDELHAMTDNSLGSLRERVSDLSASL
ncbi:hypothetical protein LTS17_008592 [Exophiala oligosperma]